MYILQRSFQTVFMYCKAYVKDELGTAFLVGLLCAFSKGSEYNKYIIAEYPEPPFSVHIYTRITFPIVPHHFFATYTTNNLYNYKLDGAKFVLNNTKNCPMEYLLSSNNAFV